MSSDFHQASCLGISQLPLPDLVSDIIDESWSPPPHGWCKINIDASWDKTSSKSGLGCVIRDDGCNFRGGSGSYRLSASVIETEAHAALMGVSLAADLGVQQVIVETDSKVLLQNIIGGSCKSVWSIYPIISAIRRRCNRFSSCNWRWIPRKCNGVADSIAASARRRMSKDVWLHRPPSSLVFVMQADGLPCPPSS
ncbi:PREDICTED: Reverse mRNAase zinc-binding domain [Prunus dulcis]|uniref:PREDICTED: Reverse mRNAase zinc-binding domain n=1 Tax=Prunus dulcis TaxID=3755 RepID=A0A5E4FJR6_PRUDU|nr:hypothetical protein L3X38_001433 [Prunus dulcis]VVA28277.1 PREDICTED: Reverse mRNAase zinc-binding domain [Prunus dulcis]